MIAVASFDDSKAGLKLSIYLMGISKCFSKHFLNVPHDGNFLMSSQRVLYLLRCWSSLNKRETGSKEVQWESYALCDSNVMIQIYVPCTRS